MNETDKKTLYILDFLSKRQNKKDGKSFLIDLKYRFSIKEKEAQRLINLLSKKKFIELSEDHTYKDKKMKITPDGNSQLKYLQKKSEKEHQFLERQLQLMEKQNKIQETQIIIQKKQVNYSRSQNSFTFYLVLATLVLALKVAYDITLSLNIEWNLKSTILFILLIIIVIVIMKVLTFIFVTNKEY